MSSISENFPDRVGGSHSAHRDVSSVAVTGANGYIGREVCSRLDAAGIRVFRLQRSAGATAGFVAWQLGDGLPAICRDVDAVVHLASASIGETTSMDTASAVDLSGSQRLIDDVRAIRKDGKNVRFIFVSSQSARADAVNFYGRSKWQIELLLKEEDEVIVRPGLVHGQSPTGVFALFKKLAALPVVPVIEGKRAIQPIDVLDLADCILEICRLRHSPRLFQLGEVVPLSFRQAILSVARQAKKRDPVIIPVPLSMARLAARLVDTLLRPTPSILERVNGLAGLQAMSTEASLGMLGVELKALGSSHD